MRDEIAAELKKAGDDVRKNYEAITANWRHKPNFEVRFQTTAAYIGFLVTPSEDEAGRIFGWVDMGTKPHSIRARRVPYLKFRWPYEPKTLPGLGRVRLGGGGTYGPNWATKKEVQHPGTEPRNFSRELTRYWVPESRRRIDNAIRRARRRMG